MINEYIETIGHTCWVLGPTGYHFDRQLFAEKLIRLSATAMDTLSEAYNLPDRTHGDFLCRYWGVNRDATHQ